MTTATVTGWPEPLVIDQGPAPLPGLEPDEAWFNEARTHRYLLTRRWGCGEPMTVIGLNPSTADSRRDDPTITRCIRFARREGCGGIKVVNLFALRATDPRELRLHGDPVGACNDLVIDAHACGTVVVAWGAGGALNGRGAAVASLLLAAGVTPVCLGVTAGGHPRHPLYVRGDAPLVPWRPVSDLQDSPVSTPPGRGLNAAADPSPAAAAPGIPASPPRDARGNPDLPAGACHPLAPAGTDPAPGHPSRPGADCGQVELPQAPARTALAADAESGGQGNPERDAKREGNAGPGPHMPGPAQASRTAPKGDAVRARVGEAGDQAPGASPAPAHEPAGGTRSSSTSPPAVPPGKGFRDAVRAVQAQQARDRRNRRGKTPVKRAGGGYMSGGNRRMPPGGAG